MILIGLDIETGNPFAKEDGRDWPREESWLTEIGIVVYDTDLGNIPIEIYSTLINEGKGVHDDPRELTHITTEMVEKYGKDPVEVANKCLELLEKADHVFAHNGNEADKPWLKYFLIRHLGKEKLKDCKFPNWVDTMTDIEYPKDCKARDLGRLANYHLLLNCFPHRAVTDVLTMMTIALRYDLERTIELSRDSEVLVTAVFKEMDQCDFHGRKAYFQEGTDEYNALENWKRKVKKKGFFWDASGSRTGQAKKWVRKFKSIHIKEGALEELDFDYEVVDQQKML